MGRIPNALDLLAADNARSSRARESGGGIEKRSGLTSTFKNPSEFMLNLFGGLSKSGASVNEGTAMTVSAYGACVNILAQSIASFPVSVMQRTGKGDEPVPDHPLNFIVGREPNESQTSFRFRSFLQTCIGLSGNSYSRILRNKYFEPVGLQSLSPSRVDVTRIIDGPVFYRYDNQEIPAANILHIRGLSTDGAIGVSPIRALRETIGLSLTAQEFTARTFNNGNRQPGVLVGSPTMNKEKANEFLTTYNQVYAGASNAGKTPFVWGGVDWKQAGFSNSDAELLLSRRYEVEEIARYFRIPLFLLSSNDKTTSWGSGIEQMARGFVDFTLQPWAKNWEEELSFSLFTADEKKKGFFFKFDFSNLLRGSPQEQALYFTQLWNGGLIKRNEAREGLGYIDLPDHLGDQFSAAPNSGASGAKGQPVQKPAAVETE